MPVRLMSRIPMAAALLAAVACTPLRAQQAPAPGNAPENPPGEVSVTVYSTADPAQFDPQQFIAQQRRGYDPSFAWQVPGFGVVKEIRTVDFEQGRNTVQFTDVAQFIDPTTVSFTDLTDPGGTAVLEQQFLFDLVSPEKLMDKYLDQPILVLTPTGPNGAMETVQGTLLSAVGGQIVLQTDAGVRMMPRHAAQVQLGELPGGLITRPTLSWLLDSAEAGQRQVRTTYQTDGITWRADYNLILSDDETSADIGAWVSLLNLSGATYKNARLKLIAGDVQRIQPRGPQPMQRYLSDAVELGIAQDQGFEQREFFEYHLYTLPRPTTIAQNTTQQITLFPTARDVNVQKVLVYYGLPESQHWGFTPRPHVDRNMGNQSNPKVDVYLRFDNSEENNLGMPLPRGKVRVYKEDAQDETLEFVGEDLIDHTPRDEELLIKLGQSFDVVGERTQTNFTIDQRAQVMTETFSIELRNHKDQPQEVLIKENLFRWVNWEIVESSHAFEKVDARTIHFGVQVPARGETTVTYTVRYTW